MNFSLARYSVTVFSSIPSLHASHTHTHTHTHTGVPPSVADKQFSDLLQGHNFSGGKDKEPKSLKEMKAKSNIEQALDPDRARVRHMAVCQSVIDNF